MPVVLWLHPFRRFEPSLPCAAHCICSACNTSTEEHQGWNRVEGHSWPHAALRHRYHFHRRLVASVLVFRPRGHKSELYGVQDKRFERCNIIHRLRQIAQHSISCWFCLPTYFWPSSIALLHGGFVSHQCRCRYSRYEDVEASFWRGCRISRQRLRTVSRISWFWRVCPDL